MSRPAHIRGVIASLVLTGAPVLPSAAAEPADAAVEPIGALEECVLRVGFPRAAFANLNENDATAAYRAFITALGRKRGYDVRPEVVVFDSLRAFENAVRTGLVHIIIMPTWELFETRLQDHLELAFVPVSAGATHRRILLLARADGRVHRLADVAGRSVLVLRDSHTTIGELWLRTTVRSEIGGSADAVLANLELVGRPHAAILPVFFGRADACVVDDQTFATTTELNPQLRKELVTVAASEPLVESVIALNRTGWLSARHREDLRQGLAELHLEPGGKQILTVFRIDRLAPFAPAALAAVAALHERARGLPARVDAAQPAAVAAGAR